VFWEDRYPASAIEVDEHLQRCLVNIDLNMVRAGAISHPVEWEQSGYREIQKPPKRYVIIDLPILSELNGVPAERCIAELNRKTEPMRWVNTMRLTTVISAAKVSL
jgi:putative transposase